MDKFRQICSFSLQLMTINRKANNLLIMKNVKENDIYLSSILNRNMRQAENIFISKPTSFSQFFRTAYNLISNSFAYHQPRSLEDSITNLLTQNQIDQHNLIEVKSFELSKQIKSKFSRFNQQEIANVLIKVKNILEEMEKLCTSLKFKFLFDLFQKVALCLTMVASLNYNVVQNKIQAGEESKKSKIVQDVDEILADPKNFIVNSKKTGRTERASRSPVRSQTRVKNRLGGISLYNQNYKRHIENRQLLISLNNVIRDSQQRRQFWRELKRDYKETIGISASPKNLKIGQNEQQNKEQAFKQLSLSLHTNNKQQSTIQIQAAIPQIIIQPEACHSANAHNMLCNSSLFYCEVDSLDFSVQTFQKTIDQITLTYQNQKYITLDTIKKIVGKFWQIVEEKIQEFKKLIKIQQNKVEQFKQILYNRLKNTLSVETQTSSYMSEGYLSQFEKLKLDVKKFQHVVEGMESIISRQNTELINERKRNIEISRTRQINQKKCIDLERQVLNLQKNLQFFKTRISNNHKVDIESHYPTRVDMGDSIKNGSSSNDICDLKSKDAVEFATERLLNGKISQGVTSIKGMNGRSFNRKPGRKITFLEMIDDQEAQNADMAQKKSKFKSERIIRTENHGLRKDIMREGRSEMLIPLPRQKKYSKPKTQFPLKHVEIGGATIIRKQNIKSRQAVKNKLILEEQSKNDSENSQRTKKSRTKSKSKNKKLNFISGQIQLCLSGQFSYHHQKNKENKIIIHKSYWDPSADIPVQSIQKNGQTYSKSVYNPFSQKFKRKNSDRHQSKISNVSRHHNSTKVHKPKISYEREDSVKKEIERNKSFDYGSFQRWNIEKNYVKDFRQQFEDLTQKNKKFKNGTRYFRQNSENNQNDACWEQYNYELQHKRNISNKAPQNQLGPHEGTVIKNHVTTQIRLNKKLKRISNSLIPKGLNSFTLNANFPQPQIYPEINIRPYPKPNISPYKEPSSHLLGLPTKSPTICPYSSYQHKRKSEKVIENKKVSKRKTFKPKEINIGQFS